MRCDVSVRGAGAVLVAAGLSCSAAAQTPVMIDVNPYSTTAADAAPANYARIQTPAGERIVFSANDGVVGNELFITDGTAAGTVLVKDIRPGVSASTPQNLTSFGSRVVFTADDGVNGRELWITDGTETGTTLLLDIRAGATGATYSSVFGVIGSFGTPNSYVVFGANDNVVGLEPWVTDGTTPGTALLLNINTGAGTSSNASGFFSASNGRVYFLANEGSTGALTGNELWSTNGTTAGTTRVTDFAPGTLSSGFSLDAERAGWGYGGAVNSSNTGDNEPAAVNFTTLVARRLADIRVGTSGSTPQDFVVLASDVYFRAGTTSTDTQLYRVTYDGLGDPVGAVLVADINPTGNDNVGNLGVFGGALYFAATDGVNGRELWKYDGVNPPSLVADLNPGAGDSGPNGLVAVNGRLVFNATATGFGREMYSTDGTALGTVRLADIRLGNSDGVSATGAKITYGSTLLFTGEGTSIGTELYSTNGTIAGTALVKDIRPQTVNTGSAPQNITPAGSLVYFTATDEAAGRELWATDGTQAGTVRVNDAWPGNSGSAATLTPFGASSLLFTSGGATNGGSGIEYYRADGTSATILADINPGSNSSAPGGTPTIGLLGGSAYFNATNGTTGAELWRYDGVNPPSIVQDLNSGSGGSSPSNFATLGSNIYFSAGYTTGAGAVGLELYRSDGTTITLVKDFNVGATNSSLPNALFPFGGRLFMRASPGSTVGSELVCYDPAIAPPNDMYLVQDIRLGANGSSPGNFLDFNGQLLFTATDAGGNLQLYSATEVVGSAVLESASPLAIGSTLTTLVKSGNYAYFAAGVSVGTNVELWAYDGVQNGGNAFVVAEINSTAGSFPTGLTDVNGVLYFGAVGNTGGNELYRVTFDGLGVPNGAELVADLNAGGSSTPRNLRSIGSRLYFTADDGINGEELWYIEFAAACPLDLSGNDIVDADDIFAFLTIWFAGPPGGACTGCIADWDGDGLITADDIFAFLNDWFAFGPGNACP